MNKHGVVSAFCKHEDDSFHDFSPKEVSFIRRELLKWYDANRRKLPWRGDPPPYHTSKNSHSEQNKVNKKDNAQPTSKSQKKISSFFKRPVPSKPAPKVPSCKIERPAESTTSPHESVGRVAVSPYATWVSEIMCQQTRVETVIRYFQKWMATFPTVQALAAATLDEVNSVWAGLGYYRRARMLHEGAKMVCAAPHNGVLPDSLEGLKSIKGIGDYTAGAILSIAFSKPAPVVDGNVLRVLSRLRVSCGVSRLLLRLCAALIGGFPFPCWSFDCDMRRPLLPIHLTHTFPKSWPGDWLHN